MTGSQSELGEALAALLGLKLFTTYSIVSMSWYGRTAR